MDIYRCLARLVFQDQRGDTGHGRQVIGLMQFFDVGRQGTAHNQPHDHLRALQPTQGGVLRQRDFGQAFRVIDQQVDKLLIPLRIIKTATFAMHLMRDAAGGHHRDAQVFREAFNCPAQRLTELVAAASRRDRELQHSDLQRHHLHRPAVLPRQQGGERREQPVIERLILEERHIKLVGHQAGTDVL
ncbi:hypothetical protein D3C78_1365290 [compost metagenome]